MKIDTAPIKDLTMDPANVRKHSERNLESIRASLNRFGQQKPIVVNRDGVILAGNGTYAAAKSLGWKEIQVVRTDLNGADAVAYAIADNRTAELAEWDGPALAETLAALQNDEEYDHLVTGFTDAEIEALVNAACFNVAEVDAPELADGDREPFRQMTFTVHDSQFEAIEAALRAAKAKGGGESPVNENSNGNALAFVCEAFDG
jgi:ParB family chromosome partitioning protein